MADAVWVGGVHRVNDPAAWTPGLPGPGDVGTIFDGTALAVDQQIGPYTLVLAGADGSATLDAFESTVTGAIGNVTFANGYEELGDADVNFVGHDQNAGTIEQDSAPFVGTSMMIDIADVTTPDGVVVQQGLFTNTGMIAVGDQYSSMKIFGAPDAELVNNGVIQPIGGLDIDVPIVGSGTIDISQFYAGTVTIDKAVSAGQTVNIYDGDLVLQDPLDFRATIGNLATSGGEITFSQKIDSARFIDHVLALFDGGSLVAEFKLSDDTTLNDISVASFANGGTIISGPDSFGLPYPTTTTPIAVSTSGAIPVPPPITLPAAPANLPTSGPDLTFTTGAHVASIDKLDGYTIRLEGAAPMVSPDTAPVTSDIVPLVPSVDETSITFGSHFALLVEGQGSADGYGELGAVGYNANDGTIAADTGAAGGAASLDVNISDVIGPDGAVILAGAYNNTGSITASAGSVVNVTGTADSKLINAGTVTADGMVFIGPAVTGTGAMTVGNHAGTAGSLELEGSVSTGQAIDLQAGTLTIDDPKQFFATVYDFDSRDTIVLNSTDVTSVTYKNGALLLDGGSAGTLHFHRPNGVAYSTASFQLTQSGSETILTTPVTTP